MDVLANSRVKTYTTRELPFSRVFHTAYHVRMGLRQGRIQDFHLGVQKTVHSCTSQAQNPKSLKAGVQGPLALKGPEALGSLMLSRAI